MPAGHLTRHARRTPIDVAVLGGGPAGAAVAGLLARWGYDVEILTRPAPRPAHAESLPPSCERLLEQVGVREAVAGAGFIRATGNTVHWGNGAVRVERFRQGSEGFQLSRDVFDRILLAQAERAGVRVRRQAAVREVALVDRGPQQVAFDVEGRSERRSARWVLDCTGRVGLVARRGWRRAEPALRTMAIIAVWERAEGWPGADPTHTVVESYDDGWGWSVPVSALRRVVTIMVDPARTSVRGGAQLETTYAAELARMRALTALVAGATRVTRAWARDASSYSATTTGASGILLVGDAASFVDPLSSYGVKKALASAWLSAVVVRTVLDDDAMLPHALELHARREREIYESLQRQLAGVSRDAAHGHASDFWATRPLDDSGDVASEPDIAALRNDRQVLAAFETLRAQPAIALAPAGFIARVRRSTVRGDRVVLEEQLVTPDFPEGERWLRSVDLLRLIELAPHHTQVPDLYDAYLRAAAVVPLPDFLGALSVLVARGILVMA